MNPPSVSVIMPSLDMGGFVEDSIGSILRQSVPVAEILLVDCGSSDDTLDRARTLAAAGAPLKVLHSDQRAPGPARNVGVEQAQGDVIAFLDVDDLWPADKLARQTARLMREPAVQMVSGLVTSFEDWDAAALAPRAGTRTETSFPCHLGAAIYRREVFERLGGFDPALLYSEDVDLLLRIRDTETPFTILRAVTLFYRRHAGSMMAARPPRLQQDFNRALFKSLTRRRARGLQSAGEFRFDDYYEAE